MSFLKLLSKIKEKALDLMFPAKCIECGRDGEYICQTCVKSLSSIEPPICEYCGIPVRQGNLCEACHQNPSEIDGIRSVHAFDGVARKAVLQLKYNNLKVMARPMAQLFCDYLVSNNLPCDVLVPVPLHSSRLRERGYNQSALLCRELGKLCSAPVDEKSLVRLRQTASQTSFDRGGRKVNVEGAFDCIDGALAGRNVLLIDDVCTTGATLKSCAAVLKEKGVLSVWGAYLCARAVTIDNSLEFSVN
jgi:competence protein ComFC